MWRNLIVPTVALVLSLVGVLSSPLYANLLWHSGGAPIDELEIGLGETVTVQLYCDDPVAREYVDVMGNDASTVADITQVTPLYLAGDLAYASPTTPDWWYLSCDWDPDHQQPLSVWGDHWDVTIKGLSEGTHSLNSDYYGWQGTNDILSVTVIPEPLTMTLLGLGGLALIRRKR
jgi:hypothetical protein